MYETRLLNAKNYFEHMTRPAYDAFQQNPSFLTAYTLAMALYHVAEWVWHHNEEEIRAKYNVGSAYEFWLCVEVQANDAGLIRDMNNAAKHVVLTRQGSTAMRYAANTWIQTAGYGEGGYGQGPYGGGATIILDEGDRHADFADVAKGVFDFWEELISELSHRST